MKCKFKVGFGILTVLATPIAMNELLSSIGSNINDVENNLKAIIKNLEDII